MSGTSAEQFALMGAVFLILGAAFVFAPQIVSAVNGFMAAVFRRGRKPAQTVPAPAAETRAPQPAPARAPEVYQPEQQASDWEEQPSETSHTGAVSRLRDEIASSWGPGRGSKDSAP